MCATSTAMAVKLKKLASKLFTKEARHVGRLLCHPSNVRQRTQGMLEREHVSLQGTLAREYVSRQGMMTREAGMHS